MKRWAWVLAVAVTFVGAAGAMAQDAEQAAVAAPNAVEEAEGLLRDQGDVHIASPLNRDGVLEGGRNKDVRLLPKDRVTRHGRSTREVRQHASFA